jgi:hypothetical protein
MPAMMVGALFYWTVALGLGGLSLVAVSALSGAGGVTVESAADTGENGSDPSATAAEDHVRLLPEPAHEESIVVRLQDDSADNGDSDEADDVQDEADDVQDVDDNAGAAAPRSASAHLDATAVEPMSGI